MIKSEELAYYIITSCKKKNKDISNMKLQKMMFYCQAYHIAKYKEKLIVEDFEAWRHGAVLPAIYNEYSIFRDKNIHIEDKIEYNIKENINEYLRKFLDSIISIFGNMTASELRGLNHNEQPWQEARDGYESYDICKEIIKNSSINKYYSKLLYKEGMNNMAIRKISLKDKRLIEARKRLDQRKLYAINEDNKDEYYEEVYNNLEASREYTWRAMNGR